MTELWASFIAQDKMSPLHRMKNDDLSFASTWCGGSGIVMFSTVKAPQGRLPPGVPDEQLCGRCARSVG